jgi:hypothetical protein
MFPPLTQLRVTFPRTRAGDGCAQAAGEPSRKRFPLVSTSGKSRQAALHTHRWHLATAGFELASGDTPEH